eukprot:1532153-Pyramimonas_sp.AAC.1
MRQDSRHVAALGNAHTHHRLRHPSPLRFLELTSRCVTDSRHISLPRESNSIETERNNWGEK